MSGGEKSFVNAHEVEKIAICFRRPAPQLAPG
jgi:hypothetical protein